MAISLEKGIEKRVTTRDLLMSAPPRLKKGTYFIQTWGCQMNVEDSEQLELHLQSIGFQAAQSPAEAQVVLLNTCSVRKKPEDKAFSMLGELAFLKRNHPEVVVGVCGCMAQARADEIKKRAPHVDFVLGTGDIAQVKGLVEDALQGKRFQKRTHLPERKGNVVEDIPTRTTATTPKLKAFVPIQYGCDKFCTFCIVPITRGRERSRPIEEIKSEVEQLARQGTREVTLLGQTVNSYGKNLLGGKVSFAKLLWELAETEALQRIRYTSPYPRDFKEDVIEAIQNCEKVMEHCHMPLQSGDNEILKAMKRLYTAESFLQIVAEIRKAIPHIGLTTDIIVGFPGETDEAFERTLEVVREARFGQAYCFAYSIRPGTPAATMPQVPSPVKKERLNRLLEVQNQITDELHAAMVGQVAEVLVEGNSQRYPDLLQGFSRDFKMIHFKGPKERTGRLAKVKLTEAHRWGLNGELI